VISGFTERWVLDAGFRGAADRYTAYGDLESFLEPEPMPLPAVPRALYVGALEPTKGVDVLLEAWRLVVEMVPGAELTVVGAGSQRDALARQTQLAGLEGVVHFEGPVSREEVQAAMDRSTTLVLPSRSEGLGRVILEASARGRPSIGTKTGGIVEVIDDGDTGTLVDIDDPQALGKAIVDLLSDPDRAARMGMAARVAVERRDPSERFEEGIRRLAELVQPR
jgi:glycosyltransferase involved in cell wall biosynthesis